MRRSREDLARLPSDVRGAGAGRVRDPCAKGRAEEPAVKIVYVEDDAHSSMVALAIVMLMAFGWVCGLVIGVLLL
jgi:hypothetical protein